MDKIADLIEAAGSRAETVPVFARELMAALESRLEAVEGKLEALAGLNAPRPSSTTSPADVKAADAAKIAKAKAALAEAEKQAADDAAANA